MAANGRRDRKLEKGGLDLAQVLEKPKHRKWNVTVVMVKPYTDFWLYRPTKEDVLDALSDLIREGQLDSLFEIKLQHLPAAAA